MRVYAEKKNYIIFCAFDAILVCARLKNYFNRKKSLTIINVILDTPRTCVHCALFLCRFYVKIYGFEYTDVDITTQYLVQ